MLYFITFTQKKVILKIKSEISTLNSKKKVFLKN